MANYVLNEEKMFSDIADGIAIIINSESGVYYGMNSFGTAVFESLMQGASTDEVLGCIKAMPGAPENVAETLDNFVKKLLAFEIVVEGEASSAAVKLDPALAQQEGFQLNVEEYTDAQELLLADPIHEVKNDTGWQPNKTALEDEDVAKEKLKKTELN